LATGHLKIFTPESQKLGKESVLSVKTVEHAMTCHVDENHIKAETPYDTQIVLLLEELLVSKMTESDTSSIRKKLSEFMTSRRVVYEVLPGSLMGHTKYVYQPLKLKRAVSDGLIQYVLDLVPTEFREGLELRSPEESVCYLFAL
jgi:hypothetical protein